MPSRSRLRLLAGLALAGAAVAIPSAAQLQPTPAEPVPSPAADLPASLVADQVTYDRDAQVLTAAGNVEVLYQGRVLRATRVIYDQEADRIRVEGPLLLTDPAGRVLMADSAELTPDLENGLILSARLLIAGQLQLAATEMRRTEGRYATLQRTVASSCTICAENPTPTWAVRASRVTEDAVLRRIYFENARLELFGLPVGWVPRASIPEPGVERATGFLAPGFQQSNLYGFGVKLPYYRVLGPSADTTITPFLTTTGGLLMEGEYRRRFSNGGFDLWGVLSLTDGSDDLAEAWRGAISATGNFDLPDDFKLEFDLNRASDETFLSQYDYTDSDQLTSIARVLRTRENDYFEVDTVAFQSLVEGEDTEDVPFVFPELFYRRLYETPGIGGRLGLSANSLGILRSEGSNMFRAGGAVDWTRDWMLPRGLLAAAGASALVNVYQVWENPTIPDGLQVQAAPYVSAELRWPWVRHGPAADHVIEPIAQLVWSSAFRDQHDVPNEDSRLPEFDETNLFSLNRFPGMDRLETGLRANLGISYTRYDPSGWSLGLTLGQVLRSSSEDEFAEGTGLAGKWSDYVGAVTLDFGWGLQFVDRALFDSDLVFRRNEFALAYDGERGSLRAAYVYLAADDSNEILGPQPETNEVALDARVRLHRNWEVRGLWRYDVATSSNLRAGAGITYGNECAEFDLSVSRRYTSSDNLPPSTSFGFNLRLAGIGANGQNDWPARVCTARGT